MKFKKTLIMTVDNSQTDFIHELNENTKYTPYIEDLNDLSEWEYLRQKLIKGHSYQLSVLLKDKNGVIEHAFIDYDGYDDIINVYIITD